MHGKGGKKSKFEVSKGHAQPLRRYMPGSLGSLTESVAFASVVRGQVGELSFLLNESVGNKVSRQSALCHSDISQAS